jgi:DNA-binding CsgD family transcriptional regulator
MSFAKTDVTIAGLAAPAVLNFMMRWTECLHGDGSLRDTLSALAQLAEAEVLHLHRIAAGTGAQRSISTLDRCASQGARPLTRAHGLALVGQTPSRAKPGTVWSLQELDRDDATLLDPGVLDWMDDRGLRDATLLVLSSTADQTDVLELFQTVPLDRARRAGLEMLAAAMAEAWGRRPDGRIARILRAAPALTARLERTQAGAHPLSASNPFSLTAAELRVCSMIQAGKQLAEVSTALGIAESTLRTHLRSIFSKAGVSGQVGLLRLLLQPEAQPNLKRA